MEHTRKDFALIHKNVFNDNRLSWQAKGLLAHAIALDGIDNVLITDSIMSELEKYGYLIVEENERGKPIYHFFDNPADSSEYLEMKRKSDKRKRKGANYKKILSDALGGVTWDSKEFVVHHINHDRGDNRESNLLILPRKMHQKYHMTLNHAKRFCENIAQYDIHHVSISDIDTIKKIIEIKVDMGKLYYQQQCVLHNPCINNKYCCAQLLVEMSKKYEYYGNT